MLLFQILPVLSMVIILDSSYLPLLQAFVSLFLYLFLFVQLDLVFHSDYEFQQVGLVQYLILDFHIYIASFKQFLLMKAGERKRMVDDILKRMNISHRAKHFPQHELCQRA